VPGYQVSRLNLMAGNDQHTKLDLNGGGNVGGTSAGDASLIQPANNGLSAQVRSAATPEL